eukprot:scaffold3960_cov116-Isochrysis_galbana.AAC.1
METSSRDHVAFNGGSGRSAGRTARGVAVVWRMNEAANDSRAAMCGVPKKSYGMLTPHTHTHTQPRLSSPLATHRLSGERHPSCTPARRRPPPTERAVTPTDAPPQVSLSPSSAQLTVATISERHSSDQTERPGCCARRSALPAACGSSRSRPSSASFRLLSAIVACRSS